MKIKIISEEAFTFQNNFTKKDIEENESQIKLIENHIYLITKEKKSAVLICKICLLENFEDRILFYEKSKSGKKIIFEIFENNIKIKKISDWLTKRNFIATYKSSLNCEYSICQRESIFQDEKKPADLRGLLNLFVLFAILNYYRLIVDHAFKNGFFFKLNFWIFLDSFYEINFIFFIFLFFAFLYFIKKIQTLSFEKKINENLVNFIVVLIHIFYLIISFFLIILLKVPFRNLKSTSNNNECNDNGISIKRNFIFSCFIKYSILLKNNKQRNRLHRNGFQPRSIQKKPRNPKKAQKQLLQIHNNQKIPLFPHSADSLLPTNLPKNAKNPQTLAPKTHPRVANTPNNPTLHPPRVLPPNPPKKPKTVPKPFHFALLHPKLSPIRKIKSSSNSQSPPHSPGSLAFS